MKRNKNQNRRRPLAFLLALLLTLLCLGGVRAQASEGSVGSIVLSVEKFTIGQGYLIEPHIVPIYSGDSCAKVFDRCMKAYGYEYENTGRVDSGFYLSSIRNADNGKTQIPDCIRKMDFAIIGNEIVSPGSIPNVSDTGADLAEFSYGQMSGWYFSYDGQFPNVGMSQVTPADGGIMRVQYTVWGLGADLGNKYEGNPAPLRIADKDALIRKVAEIQGEKERYGQAYQDAIDVLTDLSAYERDVEECLERLNKGPSEPTPTVTETPEPTPTITETPEPTPTITETPKPTPTITETPEPTPTITETPEPTPTITETPEPTPTITETPEPTPTITETPEPTPEETETPTPGPEETETPTPGPENPETPTPGPENPETPEPAKPAAPAKVAISKVASADYNKLKLTWKKVKNAAGYEISRATSKNGKYRTVATLDGPAASHTDGGLKTGTAYYYKIRAFAGSGAQKAYGLWSEAKGAKPTLAQARIAKAAGARRSAKLAWKKVDGASGYAVSRATSKNGKYKAIKTLKGAKRLTCTDKKLKKGKTYYYKVRAYRTVNGKKVYGPYSAAKSAKAK